MEATALSVGKSVVSGALSYAKSKVAEEVALQLGVHRDQAFITDELEMMQSFLMAVHDERDDNKVVKTWVKQVRDVAYDVEDCLQDFAVRLEKRSWWRTLLDRRSVATEMKELRAKVEDVSQRNVRYRLIRGSAASKPTAASGQSTISSEVLLHIAEATRTALQEKKKVDLVRLITENENDHDLRVIAVLGASSDVGVTSIIRAAYDKQQVKDKFHCRAWVRLMHPFNPHDFFVSLVRQFYQASCEETGKATQGTSTTGLEVLKMFEGQDNLVDEFNRYVTEKSYLVVITDVSTIEEWDWIKTYFPSKNGSRIIVSTQQFEVASLCTEQPYTVSEIDQNWSFEKDFYVFYKKVDAPAKEDDKPESSSRAEIDIAEPADEEHAEKPTRASTVATALEEDQLIDRAKAKAKIIELIDQGGEVITICGMGGLGKTTLARSVYQQELSERFQRRAWLTIPRYSNHQKEFIEDLFRQLRNDYHAETGKANIDKLKSDKSDQEKGSQKMTKPTSIEDLAMILLEQKCLIVLDDLSSIREWDWILQLLPKSRNNGNRIIVTTRELSVARYSSREEKQIYNLELLDETEALLLFVKKVFKDIKEKRDFDHNADMTEQANLILKKCDGLPLAISTIGSFLATKPKTAMEWRDLNKHISAELEVNPELGMINTVLSSSYDGLPYHLKSPFLYFSIFPEDHKTRVARLVRRWVAEGYSRRRRNKTAVETGNSYITDLINRSMVRPSQGSPDGGVKYLEVHDLIREIGISKATEENLVFTLEEGFNLDTQAKIRHLAVSSSWTRDKNAFESALDLSHLRSLTVFGKWESFFISDKMRFLRVLDLEDTAGLRDHHLHQICMLVHLKYLSLRRCSGIFRLPNSLGNLWQLQTLDVRGIWIINLPRTIIKLRKLEYLRVGCVREHDYGQESAGRWIYTILRDGSVFVEEWQSLFYFYARYCCLTPYFCCCVSCFDFIGSVRQMHKDLLRVIRDSLVWCLVWLLYLMVLGPLFQLARVLWILVKDGLDGLAVSFCRLEPHGVIFPRGIRNLKALHTLGIVNIGKGSAILEDLQYLTELRKLRVTGLNKKNCSKFFSVIANHRCLESLSVRADGLRGLYGCLDDSRSAPENLRTLKLYVNLVKLPEWIEGLNNLVKLKLQISSIPEYDAAIQVLGKLQNLAILILLDSNSSERKDLCLNFQQNDSFPSLLVLDLPLEDLNQHKYSFPSLLVLDLPLEDLKWLKFEQGATRKLEVLQLHARSSRETVFSGLKYLPSLKEVVLHGYYHSQIVEQLRAELAENPNRPVLKT